ncbi:MAG: phage holin family protein [Fimbriimonadia bacterium]|nr:phage holin family protein [Fimbriimonadia bacterium]
MRDWLAEVSLRALVAALLSIWLTFPHAVQALLGLMALDVITGFFAAWHARDLASGKMAMGALKKSGILILVSALFLLEHALHGLHAFGITLQPAVWVAAYCCVTEVLSLAENLQKIGVPVPAFLVRRLRAAKNEAEGAGDA